MTKKKVAILTTFTSVDEAYSLIRVVANQIRMLIWNGYEPVVIVKAGFTPEKVFAAPQVELRYIPSVPTSNYVAEQINDTFEHDVDRLKEALVEDLKDVDIVLTHDLIYQPESLKLNFAARKAIAEGKLPNVHWLHWVHSATSPVDLAKELEQSEEYKKLVSQKFPNSFVVFPNHYSIPRVARNFGFEEDEVKVVHHQTNLPSYAGWDSIMTNMVMEHDILSSDAIAVYPARLDRGKQLEVVVKIMAKLGTELGMRAHVIFCDFHSTGGDKLKYREELKKIAVEWGIGERVLFTSEYHPKWKHSVPATVVHDFFDLSNVFIMPSRSETYSLVTQEAALSGNLLMLNHDFAPFRDIYGPNAIYKPFSANIGHDGLNGDIKTDYSNPGGFYYDCAMRIKYELENNLVLAQQKRLRQERSPMYVFKNELEPLFYAWDNNKAE